MSSNNSHLAASYLALVEFLMLSKRQIIELGNEHGLTGMQTMTLFLLDRPRPMRDFITIFNCDPSNVTGIIDGLEDKKLAERCENPTDRRIKMVQLQPKGSKVRTAVIDKLTGPDSFLIQNLTHAEVEQFIGLVTKISAKP